MHNFAWDTVECTCLLTQEKMQHSETTTHLQMSTAQRGALEQQMQAALGQTKAAEEILREVGQQVS